MFVSLSAVSTGVCIEGVGKPGLTPLLLDALGRGAARMLGEEALSRTCDPVTFHSRRDLVSRWVQDQILRWGPHLASSQCVQYSHTVLK